MSQPMLTSGEVCEIAGMEPHVLDDWCRRGIVVPAEGGEGQGDHRRFSLMQTVGLAVGVQLRNGEQGCCLEYIGTVAEAFGGMTPDRLQRRLDGGATHFLAIQGSSVILDGPIYGGMIDVRKVYKHVIRKVAEFAREPKNPRGRSRGLASR